MTFNPQKAKEAGYSDKEIETFLNKGAEKKFNPESAKKAGYSDKEIEEFMAKNQPKEQKLQEPATLKGAAGAYGAGFGGGAGGAIPDVLKLIEPFAPVSPTIGATSQLAKLADLKGTHELTEQLSSQKPQNALERILETSGQFGGQEALGGAAIGGPVGGAVGAAHGSASGALYGGLKEAGVPDEWALGLTAVATLSPIAAQKVWPKLVAKFKSGASFQEAAKSALPKGLEIPGGEPPPPPAAPKVRLGDMTFHPKGKGGPTEVERLPSGLSKPRAMESETTHLATINPERQKYAIKKLNQEATELAGKSVEKHLPLAQRIKSGEDFQGHFDKEFDSLATMAKKHNPDIDITPISNLLRETRAKYRGIPSPHKDVIKIKKEMKRFSDNPETGMYNLLKIFRSNNRKRSDIFETSMLTGKQQEYSDFLGSFNKAISKSFGETLPEDSQWLSRFLNNNKDFKKYMDTKTSMRLLEPLLEGQITSARINTLAKDTKLHRKLEMSMGKEGASEVIQLAKDLKGARDSIKNLPKEKVTAFDAIFPIGVLIPFVKIPTIIHKGVKFSRSLYGYWLSSPATRHAVEDATKALTAGDVTAYKTATKTLEKDLPR